MNLTITKDQIIAGLQAVQNVVSTRTTLPILSNVLLRAEKDRVEFTATDLDVTVACKVEAKVNKARRHHGAGEKTVRHRARIERQRNRHREWMKKTSAASAAARRFTKFTDLSADEFPPLPKFKDDKKVVAAAGNRQGDAEENLLCHFHRRIALRSQRHFHQPQGPQNDAGGHRRPPAGAGGRGSGHLRKEQRRIHRAGQGRQRTEPPAAGQRRRGNQVWREPGLLRAQGRKGLFRAAHHQADRGQLSELPAGHSRRSQGTHRRSCAKNSCRRCAAPRS